MRWLITIALVMASLVARADSSLAPDEDFARRSFDAGSAAYAKGDYEAALKQFIAAREARPAPAFDFNIARCLDRLGRWSDAADGYEHFVDEKPDAENAAELRARIVELRRRTTPQRESRPSVLAPALLAGGVALLAATGGIVYGTAYADYTSRRSSCGGTCSPASVDGLRSEARTRTIVSGVLWGVAGVALVADVALWVLHARDRERPNVHVEGLGVSF